MKCPSNSINCTVVGVARGGMPTGGGMPSEVLSGFGPTGGSWKDEEGVGGVVMIVCRVQ